MRDLDAVKEHEALQRELVQKIAISLHQATGDDENYLRQFFSWADNILLEFQNAVPYHLGYEGRKRRNEFKQLILDPIQQFAPDAREQKYLLMKVLQEKILTSISSRIQGEYDAAKFEMELAEDRASA